ncbi:flagellar MS-ring protein [Aquisphaera giovannonii]|uniref:Flagellar MS-ring protein n=1 Tax=Aquisphaera giovannonii TaxID=406548 RepID=A0A5B9W5A1_9BACT|nr:hypothetical protein [Aquisphaera giovannonii]QEH35743.1 flagellar MS-ring protein [Aquisphaera giovannonii]
MRSFTWLPLGPVADGFRPWLDAYRRQSPGRRRAIRWGLAGAILAVAAVAVVATTPSLGTPGTWYLGMGRHYAADDLSKVARAFDRQRIAYQVDDQRRVAVPWSQREAAEAAAAKLELGPRLPGEIRDEVQAPGLLDSPSDREAREHRRQEQILESLLARVPGVAGAFVRVNQPRPRLGLQPAERPWAFVSLETEGDRPLPFQSVQLITTVVNGFDRGIAPESITVVDRRGHKYLDAANPSLGVLSRNLAEEERLTREIEGELDWIRGVRVSVQLPDAPADEPRPPAPTATAEAAKGPDAAAPVIAINRPLEIAEPPPSPPIAPAAPASPPATAGPRPGREHGRVWVKVPRSYYYQVGMIPGRKEPSPDDFQKLVAKTEELVRQGIGGVVPLAGPSAWQATVSVIPDELPSPAPAMPASETRGVPATWAVAAGVAGLLAALAALAAWLVRLGLRPASRREASPRGVRYHRGSAASPGPSELVREFVRRNPESAVSVLERWTSQGGETP